MMTTEEMKKLRDLALAVITESRTHGAQISARAAARCLSGAVHLVVREHGLEAMQRACARLALGAIEAPTVPELDGALTLGVIARGITPLCGPGAMRAAFAFWACERDPEAWQRVEAGIAA